MAIFYIANARFPTERAHGTQIVKMCEALADEGLEVSLICPNKRPAINQSIFDYYQVKNNFKASRLWATDFLGKTLLLGQFFYWLDFWSFFGSLFFLKSEKGADIFYARDPLLLLPFLNRGNTLCVEVHDLPEKGKLFYAALKRANYIIALNSLVKKALIERGFDESIILVADDAVDIKEFKVDLSVQEARQKLGLPIDKKIVMYIGHLYPWKGVSVLAESVKFLTDKHLVVFVGGLDRELSDFVDKYGQEEKIKIIPFQSREKIPFFLQTADVVVLPNTAKEIISSQYTSPLKLFEYMASGKPIVASDLPSLRQILNEDNSVLVTPDDPQALAQGVLSLLSSEQKRQSIIEAADSLVCDYTWGNRARKIINFIK